MKMSIGPLAQGAAGTTLVSGSVTSGTLYHQEKTAHKDLIRDITARQKMEITDNKNPNKKLRCTWWHEDIWQKLKNPPKEYSKLTEREKLLGCERYWTNMIKANFKAYNEMIELISRQEKRLYKCLTEKNSSGSEYTNCKQWTYDKELSQVAK